MSFMSVPTFHLSGRLLMIVVGNRSGPLRPALLSTYASRQSKYQSILHETI